MCTEEAKDKKYKFNELSKNADNIFKDSLDLVDIPMSIVSTQGNVIWKNSAAEHILPDEFIEKTAIKLEASKKKNPNSKRDEKKILTREIL